MPPKDQKSCQYCGATFRYTGHRLRHERTHTKLRPFVCEDCSTAFGRHDALIRHRRARHASEASVECAAPSLSQSPSSQTVPILDSYPPPALLSVPPMPSDTPRSSATLSLRPEDNPPAFSGEGHLFKDLFSAYFGVSFNHLFDSSDNATVPQPFWEFSGESRLLDSNIADSITQDTSLRQKGPTQVAIQIARAAIAEIVRFLTRLTRRIAVHVLSFLQNDSLARAGIESITSQFLVGPMTIRLGLENGNPHAIRRTFA
jgi:Zinc finger, C2H2 type